MLIILLAHPGASSRSAYCASTSAAWFSSSGDSGGSRVRARDLFPGIQQMVKVDLRTVVLDVPPQDVISRDNVSVKVSAVIYFRVMDPERAIIQVENYLVATSQLAQTTLRSVLGKHELDEMLAEREKLNIDIQQVLDAQTDAWGIKVANVEIKQVDLNETMMRAIARQAEAERERRAKVIHAEGELQASEKLLPGREDAGAAAAGDPAALSGNAHRHRRRQEHHHRVPAADGCPDAVPAAQGSRLELIVRGAQGVRPGRAHPLPADRRPRGVAPQGPPAGACRPAASNIQSGPCPGQNPTVSPCSRCWSIASGNPTRSVFALLPLPWQTNT